MLLFQSRRPTALAHIDIKHKISLAGICLLEVICHQLSFLNCAKMGFFFFHDILDASQ